MIGFIGTSPPCGLQLSQEVGNIKQSTSPVWVRQSQILDAVVDGNFSDNQDLTSIFSKVIGAKLSNGSIQYLYNFYRMKILAYTVQTQTPKFVVLGFLTVNALDEGSGISTPATITWRPTDSVHWSTPNHIFGKTTAVGVSEAKSVFQIWKEIKEFERQFFLMSQPPLDSTSVGTNTPDAKVSALNSTTVGAKNDRTQNTNTTNGIIKTQRKPQNEYVPEDTESYPISLTHHQVNLIRLMTANT